MSTPFLQKKGKNATVPPMKTKNTLHIWLVLCLVTGFLLYAASLTHAESLPFSLDTEYAELDGHPAAVLWVTPQKGVSHLLPLRGRAHSHQFERPQRAGTTRRSRSPLPPGPAYARHLRACKADSRLYRPVPDLHPFRCPRIRPPLRRSVYAPLFRQKLCPRTANGFPGTPRNAASAESSRIGGVWATR